MQNLKFAAVFLVIGAASFPAHADEKPGNQVPAVSISSGPISEGVYVSPGDYVASIAPDFNTEMANRLKKALAAVHGLQATDASATNSTVRFTVTNGARLRVSDIQGVVAKADAGAVMTTPVLAHSMTPRPGL